MPDSIPAIVDTVSYTHLLADIIQIARMNEGFFRERGLFLNGGKFFLLLGEGLTGFGKRLCLLVGDVYKRQERGCPECRRWQHDRHRPER